MAAPPTRRAPRVYLAGPEVFLPRERALRLAEEKKAICAELGLEGVFPLDLEVTVAPLPDGSPDTGEGLALAIALKDEQLVRTCDAVLANMSPFRSPSADVGTVYEVGFGRGLGKPVFGYTNDPRPYAERCGSSLDVGDCDEHGLSVEAFGCFDNLMLHGAFVMGGDGLGPELVGGSDADPSAQAADMIACLPAFRAAAQRAAAHFLKKDVPSVATPSDADFMRQALDEAAAAVAAGNHPFGAVLVVDDEVVLRGQNAVVAEKDPTRHAELVLVSAASKALGRDVLARSTLVTSTAPCPMCSGAIYWAGIGRVVYGCPAEVLGAISGEELRVGCQEVLSSGILHSVQAVGPVLGEEAAEQHRSFWPGFLARGHSVV